MRSVKAERRAPKAAGARFEPILGFFCFDPRRQQRENNRNESWGDKMVTSRLGTAWRRDAWTEEEWLKEGTRLSRHF